MLKLSTREAAKMLRISHETLCRYIDAGKVPAPEIVTVGKRVVHMWTDAEVEHVRQLLPKIANGRKTRYQKKQSAVSSEHSAKRRTQPRAAALHKKRRTKEKE